jgi:subtilisin-like proprotein convertase family protein
MKKTVNKFSKKINQWVSKNLKTTLVILISSLFATSCSKSEDVVQDMKDTKLVLPVKLENNTTVNVPDATTIFAGGGTCGSDVNPGLAVSSIVIDKEGVISDVSKVSIEVDISHQAIGQLVVELVNPLGESIGLMKRHDCQTDNQCGSSIAMLEGNKVNFNSTATTNNFSIFQFGGVLPTGNYLPIGPGTTQFPAYVPRISLDTFLLNKNIKGTWKLRVYDFGVGGGNSKLHAWAIKLAAGALQ